MELRRFFFAVCLILTMQSAHAIIVCEMATVTVEGGGSVTGEYCWLDNMPYMAPNQQDTTWSDPNTYFMVGSTYSVPYIPNPQGAESGCGESVAERFDNASWQFRQYQAARVATNQPIVRTGSVVQIHYKDGSSEKWEVEMPLSTSPLSPIPVQGSLSCTKM